MIHIVLVMILSHWLEGTHANVGRQRQTHAQEGRKAGSVTIAHLQSCLLQQCLACSTDGAKKEVHLAGGSRLTLLMLYGPGEKVRSTQSHTKLKAGCPVC